MTKTARPIGRAAYNQLWNGIGKDILPGRHTKLFLKGTDEAAAVSEAAPLCRLLHIFTIPHQLDGNPQTAVDKVIIQRAVGIALEGGRRCGSSDVQLPGQQFRRELFGEQ